MAHSSNLDVIRGVTGTRPGRRQLPRTWPYSGVKRVAMADRHTVNTGKESSVSGHDVRPRGASAVQAQAVGKRTLTESVVQHRPAAPGADGASAAPAGAGDA